VITNVLSRFFVDHSAYVDVYLYDDYG